LSWTRESRDLKFSRAISGQSAASAATSALPGGVDVPSSRRGCRSSRSQGLLRCGAQVTAGALALPNRPGVPEPEDSRIATRRGHRTRGKRRGSGRVWSSDRPCPLRDHVPLRAAGPSTYGGQDFLEGGKLPDQALECQDFHGCRRGKTAHNPYEIVKEPIRLIRLQRPWRLHRVGGLIGRPGRWSPGLYPVPDRSTSSLSASSWGHQGVD